MLKVLESGHGFLGSCKDNVEGKMDGSLGALWLAVCHYAGSSRK